MFPPFISYRQLLCISCSKRTRVSARVCRWRSNLTAPVVYAGTSTVFGAAETRAHPWAFRHEAAATTTKGVHQPFSQLFLLKREG